MAPGEGVLDSKTYGATVDGKTLLEPVVTYGCVILIPTFVDSS